MVLALFPLLYIPYIHRLYVLLCGNNMVNCDNTLHMVCNIQLDYIAVHNDLRNPNMVLMKRKNTLLQQALTT